MKRVIVFILFVKWALLINAQQITFEKNFGYLDDERGLWIEQTGNGNYIILAYLWTFPSKRYLIKIDSLGNLIWNRDYDGLQSILQPTKDNKYLILTEDVDFNIMKIDGSGDTLQSIPVVFITRTVETAVSLQTPLLTINVTI